MNHQGLFDNLENEFCPPLDSSLLAALVFDLQDDSQVEPLKSTLRELADQAAADEAISGLTDTEGSSEYTHEEGTTNTTNTTPWSDSASSASFPPASFSTPLGFLQAALPHVTVSNLRSALREHRIGGDTDSDVDLDDLWDVVASILTKETIREMEERGLDGLDEDEARQGEEWNVVRKKVGGKKAKAKAKKDSTAFTLGDVRHRDISRKIHKLSSPSSSSNGSSPSGSPAPDPWTQISSLATHLASLLPPHPPSFFSSYFHSPSYPTPYAALTTALTSIVASQPDQDKLDTESPEYADVLSNLLDILCSTLSTDGAGLSQLELNLLISDIELALAATKGDADASMDLVDLLHELHDDKGGEAAVVGKMQRGVYHFSDGKKEVFVDDKPPPPSAYNTILPSEPPPIPDPPAFSQSRSVSAPSSPNPSNTFSFTTKKPKPSPFQWQKVPERPSAPSTHPLAPFIPAYARDVNGRLTAKGLNNKRRGTGGGTSGSSSTVYEDYSSGQGYGTGGDREMRRKVAESMKRRRELLEQATRMWQRGRKGNRGGEVAIWFAERAREFQELAKAESLNASRALVQGRRLSHKDGPSTIDLHGVTAAEAVTIVREVLSEGTGIGGSMSNPLKIITGKGMHSVNQVSVLKPAVKKALVEDGWNVSGWEGGLVVRGRR